MSLSACVITRNEGRRLAACLERLAWADEVVVVDDESTDDTVEVARRLGARVFTRPLGGDFAAQRNFALGQARGDWVLFVDADEHVTDALRDEIREAVRRPGMSGYLVRRRDVHFGHAFEFGNSRHAILRLARRGAGRWQGSVHEQWVVAGAVGTLRNRLVHYSHEDVAAFIAKVNSQSTLGAARLAEEARGEAAWELVAYPLGNFLRNYVVHQGFREGTAGFVFAVLMTLQPFLARAKRWEQRAGGGGAGRRAG